MFRILASIPQEAIAQEAETTDIQCPVHVCLDRLFGILGAVLVVQIDTCIVDQNIHPSRILLDGLHEGLYA